jgi:hypothetical protein
MHPGYHIKHTLKLYRWQFRRLKTALRWGHEAMNEAPAVLGNAMPKSGSHLIIQVLQGLTRIGPFVNPGFPPVNRAEDNSDLPDSAVLANIERMLPGDIAYGYVQAHEPYITALIQPGRATIFVYRDPRDMIISHVFYATEIKPDHGMHPYYTQVLQNMEERINAAIQGVTQPGSELSSVRARYENYLGWLDLPQVLCLRFEDLILERDLALGKLLDYLESRGFTPKESRSQAIDALNQAVLPKKSGTFRKAAPGNWQEHFSEVNKNAFKSVAGDLLLRLGYEESDRW